MSVGFTLHCHSDASRWRNDFQGSLHPSRNHTSSHVSRTGPHISSGARLRRTQPNLFADPSRAHTCPLHKVAPGRLATRNVPLGHNVLAPVLFQCLKDATPLLAHFFFFLSPASRCRHTSCRCCASREAGRPSSSECIVFTTKENGAEIGCDNEHHVRHVKVQIVTPVR